MPEPILPPFSPLDDEGPALPFEEAQARAYADRIVALALKRKRKRMAAWLVLAAALASGSAFALWVADERPWRQNADRTAVPSTPALPTKIESPSVYIPAPDAPHVVVDAGFEPSLPEASLRDLLELANRARAERKYRRAETLYRSVARRFPGSDDAYAALVSAADLNREQLGNPHVALRLYRKALTLRERGALHEQALAGLAQSAETLSDTVTEAQAWRELLKKHPTSLHRPRAETRLKQLGDRP